jgi:hypothetical protein
MEGGIAILLLFIIVVVAAVIGVALYLTGGALWFGKTSPEGDKVEGTDGDEPRHRPRHKVATSRTLENTELAGVRRGDVEPRDGD